MAITINIKRIYEAPQKADGYRVLVDRVWPRGMSKEKAAINEWAKDLAPTSTLRKWFNHEPQKWTAFQQKYSTELLHNDAVQSFILAHKDQKKLTLLFGAKDEKHNQALVLKQFLEKKLH